MEMVRRFVQRGMFLAMPLGIFFAMLTGSAPTPSHICDAQGLDAYGVRQYQLVPGSAWTVRQHWGHPLDIRPPIPGYDNVGQNWTPAGQAIWNNGCVAP